MPGRPGRAAEFGAALAVTNIVVGLLAMCPTALVLSLIAYAAGGPYAPQTNHTQATLLGRAAPVEVDGDEASIVGLGAVVTVVVLLLVFAGANTAVVRRRPQAVSAARAWLLAAATSTVPSVCLVLWLFVR